MIPAVFGAGDRKVLILGLTDSDLEQLHRGKLAVVDPRPFEIGPFTSVGMIWEPTELDLRARFRRTHDALGGAKENIWEEKI